MGRAMSAFLITVSLLFVADATAITGNQWRQLALAAQQNYVFGVIDAWNHLAPRGALVSVGYASAQPAVFPPYSTVGPSKSIISITMPFPVHPVETLAEDFSYLAKLVAARALETPIVWRGDWGQLPEAIELLASRRISGKAVLRVG